MCSQVILGSTVELPTIAWNDDIPSLHVSVEESSNILESVLSGMNSKYYYSVGSFLGCSCGFHFGSWSLSDSNEEHSERVRAVIRLMEYLAQHCSSANLHLVSLSLERFPDTLPSMKYSVTQRLPSEFDLIEDTILELVI